MGLDANDPFPSHADVVVIGGGVIGLSCALALLDAGRSVLVIEREHIGSGASHGNCGTITPSHATPLAEPGTMAKVLKWMLTPDAPFHLKPRFDPALWAWFLQFAARCNERDFWASAHPKAAILRASRIALERWVKQFALDCGFETSGTLYVHRDGKAWTQAQQLSRQLQQLELPVEIWEAARLQAEEPALKKNLCGALFHPFDAMLRPDRLIEALATRIRERGGVIAEQAECMGFARGGARITGVRVATPDVPARARGLARAQGVSARQRLRAREASLIQCNEVVFALGAWSPLHEQSLQCGLPIQPGKGYSITYTKPDLTPKRPLVLRERSVCVTTWNDGFRLGSTMEFAGYDSSLNRVRLDALKTGAAEYLLEPEGANVLEEWYGWRPMTYDDLPIIGRAPGQDNLWLATGHGMMGVSMAIATAELVAALIQGRDAAIDPLPYRPARFH